MPIKIPNLAKWDKSQPGNSQLSSQIGTCLTLPNLGFLWVFSKYPKISKNGNPLFFPVKELCAEKCLKYWWQMLIIIILLWVNVFSNLIALIVTHTYNNATCFNNKSFSLPRIPQSLSSIKLDFCCFLNPPWKVEWVKFLITFFKF